MKQNYNFALNEVLKSEGGYTNDPNDKGGPTNFGITLKDYQLHIKKTGTASDVKNMTLVQAKMIYKVKYWDAMGCDGLASGVDYCVFDYGVNSGIGRGMKVLKQFSYEKDPVKLINLICNERLAFLKNIRGGEDWVHFGRGWTTRVEKVRTLSTRLTKSITPEVVTHTGAWGSAVAATVAVAHYTQAHWPYILGFAALSCVVAGGVIYLIQKGRKTTNVN